MLNVGDNPPVRYPVHSRIEFSGRTGRWCLACVMPKMEKALAFDMINFGVEYFLPLYTKVTRRRDNNKTRKSRVCLFPGYLPVYIDGKEAYEQIRGSNRVIQIINIKRQKKFVDDLNFIFKVYEMGFEPEPVNNVDYNSGTPVVVESGYLHGTRGVVIEKRGNNKFLVSIEMLGSAKITISAGCLKKTG